ncbi:MAG TPA: short-chain dehydrogenase [Chitinophagaceae bacterium]|jgi:hypothetical protein|nr:short-chain dehydrogenase [Chitinophagaceae bacterium]
MNTEDIQKIIAKSQVTTPVINISFKTRDKITGIFIRTADFDELKKKNLWRIVSGRNFDLYKESHNEDLARIFNGAEFTRLEIV